MIDIDFFKALNDTFGHPAGDIVLHDFANIMTRDLRQIDLAARYGGEEFILLLPETTRAGAMLVAQRLRRAVEQARFRVTSAENGSGEQQITISLGVAIFPDDAHTKKELLEASDAALYRAKANGRNCVFFYSQLHNRKEAS
jgi:two-component system, cell cycle response regulator